MFLLPRRASSALLKTPGLSARFPLLIRGISNSSTSLSHTLPKEDARVSVSPSRPKRIVVAITGATGVALGIRILQILKALSVETHLIISKWGAATMKYETDWEPHDVAALATKTYSVRDVSACISSGSFQHDGMIVAPCSMKSLAAIRIGFTEDLITRAADVSIKENRKLLLVTRETPLSTIHLENMLSLSKIGVTIFPPVPAFYTRPKSMDDILEQSAGRILDCFGIHSDTFPRWEGIKIPSTIEVLDITTLKEGFTLHIAMSQLQPALKFRDFIQVLKDEDDLVEITEEVDSNLEVGAIMRKAYESHLPAPLFRNVKGASKDLFSILGCPAGLRSKEKGDHGRIAHHLGLDPKTPIKEIIDYLLECKDKEPLPPKIVSVSSAPCKEHVLSEGEVHLDSLPAPYLHTSDGGKYLQTYGMWILQTPDKKWTNWSIARGMVVDDKHITGLVIKPQHIRQIADAWAAIGKGDEIPFALCFGVPPAAILVSSMPIPEGESESDYIGAILGEAVPVVKCETNDLLVPATSEMVFEGTLSLKETHIEGPFGEMHGYVFEGQAHPCPMYTVKAMTYRDNAILPVSNPGICTDETHTLIGSLVATEAKKLAIDSGLPVLDAFTPYEAQALWLVLKVDLKKLQALKTTPEEFCKKVGEIFFRSKVGFIIHEIVLVAEDIDIFNFKEVFWAYVTRHTPVADQMTFDDVTSFPLAPFVSQSPRSKTMKGGKCVTNCIFRQQYERDFEYVTCNFEKGYSKELVDKVNENWKTYGYK